MSIRITTQMLDKSRMRAGLPSTGSLLDYVKGNTNNSLLNALNKNRNTVDTKTKAQYDKLEKTAGQLSQKADVFMAEGEESLFAKARESGDSQKIYDAVEDFVGWYNDTLAALKNASGTLDDYYSQSLKAAAVENKSALEDIGVTISRDGTLGIDREKLKAADIDTLERVLGKTTGFTKKAAFLAGRISDNAQANRDSLSSQYSSAGTLSNALGSRYNLWG